MTLSVSLRPEVLAFLHAIKESPGDDTPRLILAEWLEERDDPRGRFLRLQTQLAQMGEDDPRVPEMWRTSESVRKEHELAWLGPLGSFFVHHWFRRGLLRPTITGIGFARDELRALADSESWAWVDVARLQPVAAGDVGAVADSPLLPSLTGLSLWSGRDGRMDSEAFARLVASGALAQLAILEVRAHAVTGGLAELVQASFPRLNSLAMRASRLRVEDLAALIVSTALPA